MSRWATAIAHTWPWVVCLGSAMLVTEVVAEIVEPPLAVDWIIGVGAGMFAGWVACQLLPEKEDDECTVTTPTES
jgi:hypothetical protein